VTSIDTAALAQLIPANRLGQTSQQIVGDGRGSVQRADTTELRASGSGTGSLLRRAAKEPEPVLHLVLLWKAPEADGDHLEEVQEMTTVRDASTTVVTQLRVRGRTALFDSIAQLAVDLEKKPGKKAIVVLTDGGDNASVLNRETAVARARKARVPIFAVAEGEALHDNAAADLLRDLAESTGGRMYRRIIQKKLNQCSALSVIISGTDIYSPSGSLGGKDDLLA
jgi:von Willebrand factor type A domain